ncbi:MAG: hypothetical protein Q9194_001633 [Teloschistes cf. exilis]
MGPRRKVMFPLFGDGIFTQEGDAWKHSRELLKPQFVHKQYDNLELFHEAVGNLISVLPAQGLVDLQPLFFRLTLDTTTAFLFGDSVNSLQASNKAGESTFASAFNTAQGFMAKRMRLQDLYWLVGELRSQIINILVAGRDTTACLLSWTLFLLVRHPEVLAKLREEISAALKGSMDITRSELRHMNYLQNVLKETLRLYPSAPVNSRTAIRSTMLPVGGGPDLKSPVFVTEGETIAYSVYSMHRRPDFYGMDAKLFRPERWEEDLPMNRDPINAKWGFLPFNGGPRICLGMDFGMNEAAYTVVRLIQSFSVIQLPPGEKVELVGVEKQTMTLVLSITEGCNVELAR